MKHYTLAQLAGEDKFTYDTEVEAIQSGFDNWHWMQSLGIYDQNNNEIFEGDIIEVRIIFNGAEQIIIGRIERVKMNYVLRKVLLDDWPQMHEWFGLTEIINGKECFILNSNKLMSLLIVGNIYQNKAFFEATS